MDALVKNAMALMKASTKKNNAPCWLLTELVVEKGRQLARAHQADENLVVAALYLAHTIFHEEKGSEIQKNHPSLSAEYVQPYLVKWGVSKPNQEILVNSIQAHHAKVPTTSIEAEVVKNAECFKFITVQGALYLLHDLGRRGYVYEAASKYVIEKMEQKLKLLTFPECIAESKKNCAEIRTLFPASRP